MPILKDKFTQVFLLCFTGLSAQATCAGSQPKFTIVPTMATSIEVFSTDTGTVQYRVTNQTKITRTLTMMPITSITQKNSGKDSCANPFTLTSKQSCLLTLSINGRQLPVKGIHTGPVVCKTKGSNDNSPDPFLCSQPSASGALNVVKRTIPPVMVTAGFYTATNSKMYPLVAKSSNGGSSWSYTIDSKTPPPGLSGDAAFFSASCSGQTCVAGGAYVVNSIAYPLIAKSNNGGASWSYTIDSATTLPSGFSDEGKFGSVNCSGQICVAAGGYKNTNNKEYPLLARSGNGGASWNYVIDSSTTLPPDFNNFAGFASTNCSGQNCLAAGFYLPVNGGSFPLLARSGNGGVSWSYVIDNRPETQPKDGASQGEFRSTNCSGQTCMAAGNYSSNGAQIPLLARSTNGGASWSYVIDGESTPPPSGFKNDGGFNSTYCSGQICVAAGEYTGDNNITYPLLARSGNGGASWSYVIDKSVLPSGFGSGASFSSASCSGQTCVASGFYLDKNDTMYPLLARSGNGGVSWNYAIDKTTTPPPGFSGSGIFNGSNCDGQICVASGFYDGGGFGVPLLMRSGDGGISWSYVIDSRRSTLPSDFQSGSFSAVSVSALSSLLPGDLSFLNHSFIHQPHQGVLKRHYL